MVSTDDIQAAVIGALREVEDACSDKDVDTPDWTSCLDQAFERIGNRLGFVTCARNCNAREWLFDLVWYSKDVKTGHIQDVAMIGESEWDRRGIDRDFRKLLLGRSRLKVMIIETRDEKQSQDYARRFEEEIGCCVQSSVGDRYLFVFLQNKPGPSKYLFQPYTHFGQQRKK